ncbi:MAG: threonine synthase [Calditrichaeota bacterium]|nr:threonine synthase [Calditrichota bacterium]
MKFYSTNNSAHRVDFRDAVLTGLPPDNGLYMPENIPQIPVEKIRAFGQMTFQEIANVMADNLLSESIEPHVLRKVIETAINFDAPLVSVEPDIFSLELFHGPTLAFKDFAARFMAQLMGHFVQNDDRELTILVATSGDTGSAVANGFYRVPGIRVIVLYPSGKVSQTQEKQLTTLGENIIALEIDGTFDECQTLVKQAFLDGELQKNFRLTSANSINIARLIPQSFYYGYAWSRLPKPFGDSVFSVPSGNFGNLTAGLMATIAGVPITRFVAATNVNDVVPAYLQNGEFLPKPSVHTISNAMDVGNPSNFVRMLALFNHDLGRIRKSVSGFAFTDEETRKTMREIYDRTGYVLDPHGAVGYLGLQQFLARQTGKWQGVFLETAHPVKFLDVVESTIGISPEISAQLTEALSKEKIARSLPSEFSIFKNYLMDALRK